MLKISQIRLLKKLGMIFLVTLLCFLLIFNPCIDVYANAAVGGALLLLLASILAACGITFATYESCEAGTSALYDNMDSGTQSIIDKVATRIEQEMAVNSAGISIGASFFKSIWDDIVKAIAVTFGTYVGISAYQVISSNGLLVAGESFDWVVNDISVYNAINLSLGNATLNYIGGSSSATLPSYVDVELSSNHVGCTFDVAGFTFYNDVGSFQTDQVYNLSQSLIYTIPNNLVRSTYIHFQSRDIIGSLQYFNGLAITKTVVNASAGTFTWNYVSTGANIVTGNMLGDIVLSDGICADGIWTNKSWSDFLNDQIFGVGIGALPGNPSIDTTYTPGNDIWHDGSINDDIAVGNPTIGISVPTTVDDAISLNPDIARDYDATDTKLGDIAGDTTGDTTGDSSGDTTGNPPKNGNTGALPALSLPEMLFKEKFPFCLPWDIYCFFSVFVAEPEAPKFSIPYKNDALNIDVELAIDFSEYEKYIKVVRFFVGATFVFGLIMISRKIIGAD